LENITDPVLVDTGPLISILSPKDSFHSECVEQIKYLSGTLVTTWPVITEAAWLLRTNPTALRGLLQIVSSNNIEVMHLSEDAADWIADFFDRYSDQEPQLADASLMYLADQHNISKVFTLDNRDFSIYRTQKNEALNMLPENLRG